uniref:Uncharacterized protein n=1 Tax=Piliocolobus tephrosceles TaxID=591936 RepID=A0A8C9I9J4_9PRIM
HPIASTCSCSSALAISPAGGTVVQSVAAAVAPRHLREGGWVPGQVHSFSRTTAAMAPVKVGNAIPAVVVFGGEPGNMVNLAELFKGKKSVLLGVPQDFSPSYKVRFLADPTGAFGKEADSPLDSAFLTSAQVRPRLLLKDRTWSSKVAIADGISCDFLPSIIA